MAYFYPFDEGVNALNSAFAKISVTASSAAFTNTKVLSASYASRALYGDNFNLDPTWALGDATDGNGWQFLYNRVLTANIQATDANVTKPFPKPTVGPTEYAAKIATRTGMLWKDNTFYKLPVVVGKSYTLTSWVWCNNTLQNFPNANVAACGVIATMLDSSGNFLGYEGTTITNTNDWQKVEHTFTVGEGTASINFGAYMDVPYPNGYGLSPECDGAYYQDPLACPGYGWFTGLTVYGTGDNQGDPGTSVSPGPCPSGYIECPNLLAQVSPEYTMVCLQESVSCTPPNSTVCPSSIPSPTTTTTTSTTSTTSTSTTTSTTSTTTTEPPTTTTTSTTSTTSTTTSTTTTIAAYQYIGKTLIDDTSAADACNNYLTVVPRWSSKATLGAITVGDTIYSDSSLTTPVNGGNNWIALAAVADTLTRVAFRIDASGVVQEVSACVASTTTTSTTSTTTTTTAAPTSYAYLGKTLIEDSTPTNACNNYTSARSWYSSKSTLSSIVIGDILYENAALTIAAGSGYAWIALEKAGDSSTRLAFQIDPDGYVFDIYTCTVGTTSTTTTTTTSAPLICDPTGVYLTGPSQVSSTAACNLNETGDIVEYANGTINAPTTRYYSLNDCAVENELIGYYKYGGTQYIYYDGAGGRTIGSCGITTTTTDPGATTTSTTTTTTLFGGGGGGNES